MLTHRRRNEALGIRQHVGLAWLFQSEVHGTFRRAQLHRTGQWQVAQRLICTSLSTMRLISSWQFIRGLSGGFTADSRLVPERGFVHSLAIKHWVGDC